MVTKELLLRLANSIMDSADPAKVILLDHTQTRIRNGVAAAHRILSRAVG
jgi:hypothetical protein